MTDLPRFFILRLARFSAISSLIFLGGIGSSRAAEGPGADPSRFETTAPGEVNAMPQSLSAKTISVDPQVKQALSGSAEKISATLKETRELLFQAQNTADPVLKKQLSLRIDSEVMGLGRERAALESRAAVDDRLSQDPHYQKLVDDISRIEARNSAWQSNGDQPSSDTVSLNHLIATAMGDAQVLS